MGTSAMVPWAVLTGVALAGLLVAEVRQHSLGLWLAKPVASVGFLGVAVAGRAADSTYGVAVLVALALCLLGDVLLIKKERRWFLSGLVAFLLGHVGYAVAFALAGVEGWAVAAGAAAVVAAGVPVLRWLWPNVPGRMRGPVAAYVVVISTMVALAAGATAAGAPARLLPGAVLFYLSDLFVARQRFVSSSSTNRLMGLPLYYGGQLVLASTVAAYV
jgi:uncharacterized membrane protein YhhN